MVVSTQHIGIYQAFVGSTHGIHFCSPLPTVIPTQHGWKLANGAPESRRRAAQASNPGVGEPWTSPMEDE